MSIRDRDVDEWFRRFGFGSIAPWRGMQGRGGKSSSVFTEFDEARREMERMFEDAIRNVEKMPQDLVREYETPEGGKVKEVGPIVYGYSVTIGQDGKPQVREFGNVRPPSLAANVKTPELTAEREPLADVVTTDKEIKVVVEMPGVRKEDVKINVFDSSVEIATTEKAQKKYHTVIELPPGADTGTAKSTYNNGILEVMFSKKSKPKGKEIKVE